METKMKQSVKINRAMRMKRRRENIKNKIEGVDKNGGRERIKLNNSMIMYYRNIGRQEIHT